MALSVVTSSYGHSQHEGRWPSHQLRMQKAEQGKEGGEGEAMKSAGRGGDHIILCKCTHTRASSQNNFCGTLHPFTEEVLQCSTKQSFSSEVDCAVPNMHWVSPARDSKHSSLKCFNIPHSSWKLPLYCIILYTLYWEPFQMLSPRRQQVKWLLVSPCQSMRLGHIC